MSGIRLREFLPTPSPLMKRFLHIDFWSLTRHAVQGTVRLRNVVHTRSSKQKPIDVLRTENRIVLISLFTRGFQCDRQTIVSVWVDVATWKIPKTYAGENYTGKENFSTTHPTATVSLLSRLFHRRPAESCRSSWTVPPPLFRPNLSYSPSSRQNNSTTQSKRERRRTGEWARRETESRKRTTLAAPYTVEKNTDNSVNRLLYYYYYYRRVTQTSAMRFYCNNESPGVRVYTIVVINPYVLWRRRRRRPLRRICNVLGRPLTTLFWPPRRLLRGGGGRAAIQRACRRRHLSLLSLSRDLLSTIIYPREPSRRAVPSKIFIFLLLFSTRTVYIRPSFPRRSCKTFIWK